VRARILIATIRLLSVGSICGWPPVGRDDLRHNHPARQTPRLDTLGVESPHPAEVRTRATPTARRLRGPRPDRYTPGRLPRARRAP
jgi:hypothetical protein